jgi:hypothetical protein
MAKIIEQIIEIKLSKLIKDSNDENDLLTEDQCDSLIESIPELVESVLQDSGIIVEIQFRSISHL